MGDSTVLAMCGLECGTCDWRESTGCPGCHEGRGKMFWGECALAACCLGKGLPHCGLCAEFPCGQLEAFAYDKEHGDPQGSRINNLRRLVDSAGESGSPG